MNYRQFSLILVLPLWLLKASLQATPFEWNAAEAKPFFNPYREGHGTPAATEGWAYHAWDESTQFEIGSDFDPITGTPAVRMTVLEGTPSLMFFHSSAINTEEGKTYTITFSYLTTGEGLGGVDVALNDQGKMMRNLTSDKEWTDAVIHFTAESSGPLSIKFRILKSGSENSFFVRQVKIEEGQIGDESPGVEPLSP